MTTADYDIFPDKTFYSAQINFGGILPWKIEKETISKVRYGICVKTTKVPTSCVVYCSWYCNRSQ